MRGACPPCIHFLSHLCSHKPRPTTLYSIILALPEGPGNETLPKWKAYCVYHLGLLAIKVEDYKDALDLLARAKQLFVCANDQRNAMRCMETMGTIFADLGEFLSAKKILSEALKVASMSQDRDAEAYIFLNLGWVGIFRGKEQATKLLPRKGTRTFQEK